MTILTYWLTGARVTDRSDASGTGYFNAVTGQWIAGVSGPGCR